MKLSIKDKLILSIMFILALFGACSLNAQNKMNVQAGYKAVSIGYTFQDEEFLNFGLSASVVESGIVEKRANRNDTSKKIHEFKSDLVPALFGEIGATFDEFTITGKLGCAYLNQSVNCIQEKQKLYYAVGIRFDYKLSEKASLNASYDSVNAVMAGISFNLKGL